MGQTQVGQHHAHHLLNLCLARLLVPLFLEKMPDNLGQSKRREIYKLNVQGEEYFRTFSKNLSFKDG